MLPMTRMPNAPSVRATLAALAFVAAANGLNAQATTPPAAPPQGTPAQRQAPPAPAAPKKFRAPSRRTFDPPNRMRVKIVP